MSKGRGQEYIQLIATALDALNDTNYTPEEKDKRRQVLIEAAIVVEQGARARGETLRPVEVPERRRRRP